jgi:hypothetical protein
MKKITFLVAFIITAFVIHAQVILDETFNYSSASLLTESSWTNTLSANGAAVGTIGNISSEPLSYGDANGMYALSSAGKLITSDYTSGGDDFKVVKALPTSLTSGVVYMSLLCRPGVAQGQANAEIIALSIGGGNGPKVLIGKGIVDGAKFRFATTRASSSKDDYRWTVNEYADVSQTFLLVVKYDWTAKAASLFVNPVVGSATEPTPDVTDNNSAKDVGAAIDGIRFRVNGSSAARFQVSGVRVSTSWAAAVGKQVAELAAPAVSAASDITNLGFTANWTPVADAIGYDVMVFDNGDLAKTVSVTGQATSSATITDLKSNTAYTYKVTAVADKITYANSQPSADSPVVTTTGLSVPEAGAASDITSTGFTANWSSVANATSYDVVVFQNTTLLKMLNATGQSVASLAVTGLQMGTTYSYKVIAKGTMDSSPSQTVSCNTLAVNANSINTDFGDAAVWGAPVPPPSTNLPLNGNYPIWKSNGFSFEKALIYGGSTTGVNGETHINAISFDKLTTAAVVFPTVNSVAQIEFHANSGSDAKSIVLEELGLDGTTWNLINTYTTNKLEATFIENVSRSTPATFRLRNNVTSSMNVSQIIVRPTMPTTSSLATPDAPNAATNLIAGGFTASWTPIANATGYIVSVWNYAKPVNKNFTVSGQATNTYNVVGLDSASLCTYKIAAVGDGITYTNSLLSAASESFSIAEGLLAVNTVKASNLIWNNGKTIFVPEIGSIEVYNLQGTLITQNSNVNQLITNLKSGLYIVRFKGISGMIISNKILVK